MITFCPDHPEVNTPLGKGVVWYITLNGFLQNDELCIILCESGEVKHMSTQQVTFVNYTYGINVKKD